MPSSGSSKIASKRNRKRSTTGLFWCMLFLLVAQTAAGQGALLTARLKDDVAVVSLSMVEASEKLLVKSAYDGQMAQVRFDLRIYHKGKGFLGIAGDRIIREKSIEQYGRWDPFSGRFIITDTEGHQWTTPRAEEYTRRLLSLSDTVITGIARDEESYLLARVGLKRVKLQVPFNLLDLFLPETKIVSPWVRWDFNFGEQSR